MESEHEAENTIELNAKTLDTYGRLYELLTGAKKHQMTVMTRQEKLHELYPLVLEISKNPLMIWSKVKVRKKDYMNRVMLVFEILRGF
jgi:uncharacterized membrane-anchored protein YitT (DUF2179 family)